ncbi:heterokaryon incompatibility protein-domain-containing protein [Thelonectria olida]|uniref:Heterokaryon incompatibility protein-domain-containing protein n=1 Tax=Thelonectria olida TaxID=1576542 RepID=A0A9P8VQ65_9HYPO|nr:heterokaryon incompatibility protein-domain-containing protein [Thelonectria olida]
MRLINTKTLEVEEFFDICVPEYAILSHTWGDGEVSLQEWADCKNRRFKSGFQKIIWACSQATKDQLYYVWVDTNCIDKTSSAELSEAINSMFKWYRRSLICYVYLEDELIAPPNVNFFSNDWTAIAIKSELAPCISEIIGIAWSCLLKGRLSKSHLLRRYSVAQRLTWASRCLTTQGHEAFTRLLREIIHKYADHSFFASQLRYQLTAAIEALHARVSLVSVPFDEHGAIDHTAYCEHLGALICVWCS